MYTSHLEYPTEKPGCDVEIVGVIDGEINQVRKSVHIWIVHEGEVHGPIDPWIIMRLQAQKALRALMNNEHDPFLRGKGKKHDLHPHEQTWENQRLADARFSNKALKIEDVQKLPERTVDALIDGTPSLHWLINSGGGTLVTAEAFCRLSENVRLQGGQTHTYVPNAAGSAAALIFCSANNRDVADDAALIWHGSAIQLTTKNRDSVVEKIIVIDDEQIAVDMNRVLHFFHIESDPEFVETIRNIFWDAERDPKRPQLDVRFLGYQLERFGMAASHSSERDLAITFAQRIGVSLKDMPTKLRAFFK